MYTHKRDVTYSMTSGMLETTRSQSAEAEHEISIDIPGDTEDQVVAFELDIDQLKGFFMAADGPLTVETWSAVPALIDTFDLLEHEPIHFLDGGDPAEDNPFTADIASLKVSNEAPDWIGETVYAVGDIVRPVTPAYNTYKYVCTVAGTTAVAEPVWPTAVGGTIAETTGVTWECLAGVAHLDIRALIDPTV